MEHNVAILHGMSQCPHARFECKDPQINYTVLPESPFNGDVPKLFHVEFGKSAGHGASINETESDFS